MISLDEDALICDFAETYHIYDYRSLPVKLVATLAAGLRDDSRIKLLAADAPVSQDTLLLAMIADRIEAFRCGFSDNPGKKPVSIIEAIMGERTKKKSEVVGFRTVEEFEARLAKIRGE